MPSILGIRGTVIQVLNMVDDRVGVELQGEEAGAVALSGVWEGLDEGVTGGVPPNLERRGERGVDSGGQQGRQG